MSGRAGKPRSQGSESPPPGNPLRAALVGFSREAEHEQDRVLDLAQLLVGEVAHVLTQ
jgi:hypothetical protein